MNCCIVLLNLYHTRGVAVVGVGVAMGVLYQHVKHEGPFVKLERPVVCVMVHMQLLLLQIKKFKTREVIWLMYCQLISATKKKKEIRHLNCWRISDQDIPDDRDENERELGQNGIGSKRRRTRGKNMNMMGNSNAWFEYWKLMEMNHSMAFISEYNKGLLQQTITKK
eukprot:495388_1